MNFSVEELPSYRTAYIRRVGVYGTKNSEVMESLKRWAKAKIDIMNNQLYGR